MTEKDNCESRALPVQRVCVLCKHTKKRERERNREKKENEQWSKSIICNTCTNY